MLILFHLLHLLQGYRDMATYRKVFSVVKNPPYCQVIFLKKRKYDPHGAISMVFEVEARTSGPNYSPDSTLVISLLKYRIV